MTYGQDLAPQQQRRAGNVVVRDGASRRPDRAVCRNGRRHDLGLETAAMCAGRWWSTRIDAWLTIR